MEFQPQMRQYPFDDMLIDASASVESYMGKHPCDFHPRYNEALDSPSPPSTEDISDTDTEAATEIVEETEGKRALPSRLQVNFTTPIDDFDPLQRRLANLPHRIRRSVLDFFSLGDIPIQYALYPLTRAGFREYTMLYLSYSWSRKRMCECPRGKKE